MVYLKSVHYFSFNLRKILCKYFSSNVLTGNRQKLKTHFLSKFSIQSHCFLCEFWITLEVTNSTFLNDSKRMIHGSNQKNQKHLKNLKYYIFCIQAQSFLSGLLRKYTGSSILKQNYFGVITHTSIFNRRTL